jgi:hypothetical protein
MLPTTSLSPLRSDATMATTCVSNSLRLGKAVGLRPFSEKNIR